MESDLTSAVQAAAQAILTDERVDAALEQQAQQLTDAFSELDRDAIRIGLLYTLASTCLAATEAEIAAARDAGIPWNQIADPMGLAVSTVRTRFHAPTSQARRRYEEKRQSTE